MSAVSSLAAGNAHMTQSNDDPALAHARAVLKANLERLLTEHAATGVDLRRDQQKRPVIVVYLPAGRELPGPDEIDGVPVIFEARTFKLT